MGKKMVSIVACALCERQLTSNIEITAASVGWKYRRGLGWICPGCQSYKGCCG